jgi:hypothetical protein
MLSAEQQKELLCLAVNGRISPIKQFIEDLNKIEECRYTQYIKHNKPLCMFCGSNITTLDHTLIRNMDCASTSWEIGCCCCGDGEKYHKPERAQFYCSKECYNNASNVRHKVFDLRISNDPTDEYYALNTTNYIKSAHLMKKYHSSKT